MIKICHVVESSAGGVLSVIKDSIEMLQFSYPEKYDFTIVHSIRSDTPTDITSLFSNVKFIHVQMGHRAFETTDLKTIKELRRLFKEFDVVHLHSSRAGFLGRISLFTIKRKMKSYYSPHGFGFLNLEFSKFKRIQIWLIELFLSKISRTKIIACGKSEYMLSKKISGNSILITNGYTPSMFDYNKQHKPKSSELLVVGSGRNALQKDPSYFVSIYKRNTNLNLKFKWIGDIDSELATGWMTREEAYRILEEGDVFLATSLWEGLPVNGIEALTLGMPLIVRGTSSYVDLVQHGVNGFVFFSVSEALEYLGVLQANKSMLKKMSINAKKSAKNNFSSKNYLELDRLYSKVV